MYKRQDLNVTFFPSYGAAMRGGTANCYVVISDEDIGAPVSNSVDDLVVMNGPSLHKFLPVSYTHLYGSTSSNTTYRIEIENLTASF